MVKPEVLILHVTISILLKIKTSIQCAQVNTPDIMLPVTRGKIKEVTPLIDARNDAEPPLDYSFKVYVVKV